MDVKRSSSSGLLMLELLICIGVFALCAALCTALFAKADAISRNNAHRDQAVTRARAAAEVYRACGGDLIEAGEQLGGEIVQGMLILTYDQDWDLAEDGEIAAFTLDLLGTAQEDGWREAALTVHAADAEAPILSWTVAAWEVAS